MADAAAARGYGYRIRDDRRAELGIQPDPLKQRTAGDVADAAARALLPDGTTSTAAIVQASTGLLFYDRFNRPDGALGADWTTINGTHAIVGNLARSSPAAATAENVVASVLAAAAERVVQAYQRASAATIKPALRVRWDSGLEAAANSYLLELVPGVGFNLSKQIAGAITVLAAYAQAGLAAGVLYGMKLHAKNGSQKAYADARAIAATTDVALDAATGKAGIRANNTSGAGGPTADTEDFAVYASNTVTVNGLPAGYQVRINGTVYASAGGSAACELAGAMCPLQAVEVLDAFNNVAATLVPAAGIWGGDVYTFLPTSIPSSITVTALSDVALRVSWAAIADASGYRIEWHNGNGVWAILADVAAGILYADQAGLTEGVVRYYRVTSQRDGAYTAPSGVVSGTTPLSAPNNLTITSPAPGGVNLTWTDRSAKEVNYQLQRSTDGSPFVDIGLLLAANTGATIDTTAAIGHAYSYRVATIAADSVRSYSNEASANLTNGTGGLARTAAGLLFADNFNRANGAAGSNWSGGIIAGNQLEVSGANNFVTIVAAAMGGARINMHVQARIGRSANTVFAILLVRYISGGDYFQIDHRSGASGQALFKRVATAFTQIGVTGSTLAAAPPAFDLVALSTIGTDIRGWHNQVAGPNGNSGGSLNAVGVAGIQSFSGGTVYVEDYIVTSDRVITCTNLPIGWKLRLGGAGGALSGASPGGGPAVTLDPLGVQMPFAQIDVIDGAGTVQQSFTPIGGLYGGDTLDWTGPVQASLQTVNVGIGPGGTYDGVVVAFAPYYVGTLFNGASVINSKPNLSSGRADTSQSLPIDITFDQDVASVTVTLYDPTFAGNYLIAYNGAGVELGRVESLTSSSFAGVATTVTFAGIRKVTISPVAGDFIAILDVKFKH